MNKFLQKANQRISLGNAAALLVGVSLAGQVLGFLRTKLVNANFALQGPHSTDAYFAAFQIPDFFFYTIAAGALGVAFMPILADHLQRGDRKGVWQLSTSLLNLLALAMFIVGVVIFIFAPELVQIVGKSSVDGQTGLGPEQREVAVNILRLIAFNPLLFTISGVLASVQQTFGRFFFYAIGPLVYNLSISASAIIFSTAEGHHGGPWNLGLTGLGLGALIGALLQLFVILFGLHDSGFHWRPKILWKSKDFKLILRQLPPRSIDQGVDSINSIAETRFAAGLGSGNISFYQNAFILHGVPVQLIGTTISTAAFPRLTARLSQGRPDLFRKDFLRILRVMIWLSMPVIVIAYFGRGYLARLIFTRDASEIAVVFGYLVVAIFFRIVYSFISRWFYAQKDTKTPLFVSLFTIGLNIFLAYTLSRPWAYGVEGLAMAQSIVAAVEVIVLFTIMLVRDNKLFNAEFWGGIVRIMSVTGFSLLTAFIMFGILPLGKLDKGLSLGIKLAEISIVTFGVHLGISLLFGLEEASPIVRRVRKFIEKPIKIFVP